jgi:acetyl-CoA/propionyl-CoA carboxylase biotin carboxyl carrier protein
VYGVDREHARQRMLRALDEYEIAGVETLLGFHRALLRRPCFIEAGTCRGVTESPELADEARELSLRATVAGAPAADGRLRERVLAVELDGRRFDVRLLEPEPPHVALARRRRERHGGVGSRAGAARDAVVSPMQGGSRCSRRRGPGGQCGRACIVEA